MTWHASKDRWYTPDSQEAIDNATEAANILINDYGWTQAACAGMFGSIDYEGMWNPWSWQGSGSPEHGALTRAQAQAEHGTSHGYGLIGWTPSGKYQFNDFTFTYQGQTYRYFPGYDQESYPGYGPYFKNEESSALASDGAAQIRLIAEAMANNNNNIWVHRKNCTQSEYIALTDPKKAAYYWTWNAEYPSGLPGSAKKRQKAAVAWMNRLSWVFTNTPEIWLLSKKWYRL